MSLREGITTIICVIVLFVLVVVLFMVKGNMDKKSNTTKVKTNTGSETTVVITYNVNGGETLTSTTIKKGENLVLPTPVRKGYSFVGWYVDGKLVDDDTNFTSNTTLVAKWIIIEGSEVEPTPSNSPAPTSDPKLNPKKSTFVVSFDSKGGSRVSSITCNCNNTPLKLPNDPTKSGYTFVKWVDKNNNTIENGSIINCEDITLYAIWKVAEPVNVNPDEGKKYVISFETGTGVSVDPVVLECGRIVAVDLPVLDTVVYENRTQYFKGWRDAAGNIITSGKDLKCEDTTLYASWLYMIATPTPAMN